MRGACFWKIYLVVEKIFEKQRIIQNYPTASITVIARKNPILEIAENKIEEIFTAQRYELNTHVGSNLIKFHKLSVCFYQHLSLVLKNYRLKIFCNLFEIKHTEIVYSCIFDLHYTKVLNNGISITRVKFKINRFRSFLFVVAMEMSIIFKEKL